VRANVRRLREAVGTAEAWAVVKANGYGHGAVDVAVAALESGATALCVATVAEGVELRTSSAGARIVLLGPAADDEIVDARQARLELVARPGALPEGIPVHLELDTGMGRWGLSELPAPGHDVVGLMTHFASADNDPAFTARQLRRFLEATAEQTHLVRHVANSAAALTLPESRLDAVRCGIALYGISPTGDDPAGYGLQPVLRWCSEVAQARLLAPGESTGYGRTFVAPAPTWIALVPVGYADGFRRDMTGSEILVGGTRCRVVGTVSMDVIAVETSGQVDVGTDVVLVGDGILIEDHARVAGTIAYEIACGLDTSPTRAERRVVDD
jgi:alanine racemase